MKKGQREERKSRKDAQFPITDDWRNLEDFWKVGNTPYSSLLDRSGAKIEKERKWEDLPLRDENEKVALPFPLSFHLTFSTVKVFP